MKNPTFFYDIKKRPRIIIVVMKKVIFFAIVAVFILIVIFGVFKKRDIDPISKLMPEPQKTEQKNSVLPVSSPDSNTGKTNNFKYETGIYDFDLKHDGVSRHYKVYVPESYTKNKNTPAVLYLHGGGGNKETVKNDGLYKYSDKYGFLLISPEGTGRTILGKLFTTWNAGEYSVNGVLENVGVSEINQNVDDVGFISKVIDEVKENFNVDSKRVYATGISNGAILSYALGCKLADKVTAIAPVAPPGIPDNCNPSRAVPVMHIHGTGDLCTPYNGGLGGGCLGSETFQIQPAEQMVARWRNLSKCSVATINTYKNGEASCVTNKECSGGSEVTFCTVRGMGHAYPSGKQYLPERRIGPVSYDISFDQIWEFFKKYSI